jgi:cell division protein ZapA (FtsZ GTPase activity inhibitor)
VNEPLPETVTEDSPPQYQPGPKGGPHDLLIDVLGASFSITASEAPEYLDEVLAQYRAAVVNTQGISGMKDPLKVAILTGFLLCDEINKIKLQVEEDQANAGVQRDGEERELSRITQNLIACIDQAMEKVNPFD